MRILKVLKTILCVFLMVMPVGLFIFLIFDFKETIKEGIFYIFATVFTVFFYIYRIIYSNHNQEDSANGTMFFVLFFWYAIYLFNALFALAHTY